MLSANANRLSDDGATADIVSALPKERRVGAYRINRILGGGGMGFVYKATHEVLNGAALAADDADLRVRMTAEAVVLGL